MSQSSVYVDITHTSFLDGIVCVLLPVCVCVHGMVNSININIIIIIIYILFGRIKKEMGQ